MNATDEDYNHVQICSLDTVNSCVLNYHNCMLYGLAFCAVVADLREQHPNEYVFRKLAIRYDTRCYFNVRSKANMSQLNLPHGTDT